MAKDNGDYEVGYGKPPKATRFKKGQSGNPKGRPKGAKSFAAMAQEAFTRKIKVTTDGQRREVTIIEAILLQLANNAAKGDPRSMDRAFKLMTMIEDARSAQQAEGEHDARDPDADRAVLETFAEMFGTDSDQLFASFQEGQDDE